MFPIEAYMIVVKDSEASNYYADYCIPSWEKHFKVNRFDAITPKNLHKQKDFKFSRYSSGAKYLKNNLKAEITKTEQACFYSHYSLWLECSFQQKPIMILEHDAFLQYPEKLWYEDKYGIIFYDDAAMGAYIIQPWFAERLVRTIFGNTISMGPYSIIESFARQKNILDLTVNKSNKKFVAVSDQVMSKKYGNTVEHYCNNHPEHWPPEQFHKFIEID